MKTGKKFHSGVREDIVNSSVFDVLKYPGMVGIESIRGDSNSRGFYALWLAVDVRNDLRVNDLRSTRHRIGVTWRQIPEIATDEGRQ
jgi:hypothetical protein